MDASKVVPHGWAAPFVQLQQCDISRMQNSRAPNLALPGCFLTKPQPTDVKYFYVSISLRSSRLSTLLEIPSSHSRLFVSFTRISVTCIRPSLALPSSPQGYSWLSSRNFNYRYFVTAIFYYLSKLFISIQLHDLTISRSLLLLLDWS